MDYYCRKYNQKFSKSTKNIMPANCNHKTLSFEFTVSFGNSIAQFAKLDNWSCQKFQMHKFLKFTMLYENCIAQSYLGIEQNMIKLCQNFSKSRRLFCMKNFQWENAPS